jgi:uncharacterized membrane protein
MAKLKHNRIIRLIFFGNYFYAICGVALSIEGTLQQKYPLSSPLYFVLAFSAIVVYYTKAYIMTEVSDDIANLRSMWYARNKKLMNRTQLFFLAVLVVTGLYFLVTRWHNVMNMTSLEWFSIVIFPIVSALYYGVNDKRLGNYSLRNVGWLKPFIIGYTWAGLVTVYPILFYCIDHGEHYHISFTGWFLFIKNFMFITILCIMFDVKDYAMDYNQQLKTVVIKLGLRRTIFYFIIPLCVVGLASFLIYATAQHFSAMKIFLNTLPFLAIIAVAYSMYRRKSIFYYLMVIDGLMLFKALCGIVAMKYF